MKKIIAVLLGMVMLLTCFAGCSSQSAPTASGEEPEAGGGEFTHKAKIATKDEIKIAYVPNTSASANATAWLQGIEEYLAPYKNVTVRTFDGKGEVDTQIAILADVVNGGFDALLIQCVDQTAENDAIQEVMDAGIPVISLNIKPTIPHTACFSYDSWNSGISWAEAAAASVGGKGNWVSISVPPEVTQLVEDAPWVAFEETIDAYGTFTKLEEQACDFTTESGQEIMRDYLTKYDQIDFVFGCNDAVSEGIAMACQAAGRNDIKIWGCDGDYKMLEYIKQGLCTGTIFINYYEMGSHAAALALYAISSNIDLNKQSSVVNIYEPYHVVTAENVDEFIAIYNAHGVFE